MNKKIEHRKKEIIFNRYMDNSYNAQKNTINNSTIYINSLIPFPARLYKNNGNKW